MTSIGWRSKNDINKCIKNIWQNPISFHIKNSQQTRNKEFSQPHKDYDKAENNLLNDEKLIAFLLRLGTSWRCPLSPLLFNNIL